jgi:TRAP-type C4-dicarboxylate transport system permease small subunit
MKAVRKTTESAIVALFAVLVGVVFFQVVSRYVFNRPPVWTEELARYLQVWIILLTSPLCIRKGSHLAVDYFGQRLKPTIRHRLDILTGLLVIIYAAVVTVHGFRLMVVGRFQVSPAMGINMSLVYLVLPVAGALMLVEAILRTWILIKPSEEVP